MDRLLYIAMNGAKNALHGQQTNANNLANVSTTGFKAQLDHFSLSRYSVRVMLPALMPVMFVQAMISLMVR